MIYVTNSLNLILARSIAFSLGGVVVILTLESTSRTLVPDWEKSLPPEAQSLAVSSVAGED